MKKTLTGNQEKFLELVILKGKTYGEIEKELNVPKSQFSLWWEELKERRLYFAEIRKIWKYKFEKENVDIFSFKKWYEETTQQCHYCKITTEQTIELWKLFPDLTKRNRGKKLEIERLKPNEPYSNTKNLVFSCYWCNNAKTDTFTEEEFIVIGQAIKDVWEQRLKK